MSHRVVEGDGTVEIGLPVLGEDAEVVFPAAFVEAFADGVGNIAGGGRRPGAARAGIERHRPDDFAGGVEEQSVPE